MSTNKYKCQLHLKNSLKFLSGFEIFQIFLLVPLSVNALSQETYFFVLRQSAKIFRDKVYVKQSLKNFEKICRIATGRNCFLGSNFSFMNKFDTGTFLVSRKTKFSVLFSKKKVENWKDCQIHLN